MSVKKVLIAHQSTIPHYRMPFYRAVERLRPSWWEFTVVYDADEAQQQFFVASDNPAVGFPVISERTYALRLGKKRCVWQNFLFKAWKYDLIVVGHTMHNLSYPFAYFWRIGGKSIAYWGQGRDTSVEHPTGVKALLEKAKLWLVDRSDGFFAYTKGVRDYMVNHGIDEEKIFTLYNTIDIQHQREIFENTIHHRDVYRKQAGLDQKKVLLFVGRLNDRKRLDFLVDSYAHLRTIDQRYHLIIIGGGDISYVDTFKKRCGDDSVSYHGIVADKDMGYFYTISDLFVFPGAVGLGPIQSLCFDLTPVIIESKIHNPEREYLNEENALICKDNINSENYARMIENHLRNRERWEKYRLQAWPSIQHLTIDHMASNFIHGINAILSK